MDHRFFHQYLLNVVFHTRLGDIFKLTFPLINIINKYLTHLENIPLFAMKYYVE